MVIWVLDGSRRAGGKRDRLSREQERRVQGLLGLPEGGKEVA